MDRNLEKWAEKAASIRLAAPFLKVPQAICVDGADNNDADNNAADNDADDNTDANADKVAATQMMDDAAADNDAVAQTTDDDADDDTMMQTTTPRCT